jgi:hypothetical protein
MLLGKPEAIYFSFTEAVKAGSLFYAMKTPIIAYFFACISASSGQAQSRPQKPLQGLAQREKNPHGA